MEFSGVSRNNKEFLIEESRVFVDRLSDSKVFKEYKRAFSDCSRLSLILRPIRSNEIPTDVGIQGVGPNSCKDGVGNAEIQLDSFETVYSFTEPCHAEVPVLIGEKTIAFLQTDPVLRHESTQEDLDKITGQMQFDWVDDLQLNGLENKHARTPVISEKQFDASIRILKVFAKHLALIGNSILVKDRAGESWIVSRARKYIDENYDHHLALAEAAKAGNASIRYFSKVFKEATRLTFVDYLTRVRIEKSKSLLLNPNKRISEIAFEVGFDSISQFNRSFRKICGQTPSKFRNDSLEDV